MERWHSLGCKIALSIGLLFAPLTVIAQTEANIPEVEESDVATLSAPSSHWITALSFFDSNAARIIDGDSGKVLGAVHVAPMSSIVFAPDGKHIYVAETIWTKGNRGTRQDMVTVYDARTLKLETEIPLSGRLLTGYRHALFAISTDGKIGYVYNMSPASSVIVVDLIRVRTHSQKRTVAARAMAERKTVGHLS